MNTKAAYLLFTILILVLNNPGMAQISGLWEVTNVKVGDEDVTPIARWSQLNEDGSFVSGNGWLQNSDGTWVFDEEESTLTMIIQTGFDDPFEPFSVAFPSEDVMIWNREEQGMQVTVTNRRVNEKPKAPADLVVGLWDLVSAEKEGVDATEEFDPNGNRMIFIRWDHLVHDFTSEGRISGVWRIDAHRPVLDILYYDTTLPSDYWGVSFESENEMTLEKEGLKMTFNRLKAFPED